MGQLLITAEGFEIANIPLEKREESLYKFFRFVIEIDNMKEDDISISHDVASHHFSYGNIYSNLFYAEYKDLKALGINGLVYQLMSQNINRPSFNSYKSDNDWNGVAQPKGYTGFEGSSISLSPYFYTMYPDWLKFKADYFKKHHDEIPWDKSHPDYIPNPHYLLLQYVDWFHKNDLMKNFETVCVQQKVEKLSADTLCPQLTIAANILHEYARGLGVEIHAFSEKIGSIFAEANFYVHEPDLSNFEKDANSGSFRAIYSLYGSKNDVLYISIDFKHCMLEYHNEIGDHLGEYRLDGTSNKQNGGDAGHSFSKSSKSILKDIRKRYHEMYYKN